MAKIPMQSFKEGSKSQAYKFLSALSLTKFLLCPEATRNAWQFYLLNDEVQMFNTNLWVFKDAIYVP
jgi:hypothetical protein